MTGVTSSTITVQWEMVPCIHLNGEITYRSCFNLGVVISVSITEIVIHDMIGRECCAKVCT